MNPKARKYFHLRSQLVRQGTTLRRWAESRGYCVSTVYDAIRGTRQGEKSKSILKDLEDYLDE